MRLGFITGFGIVLALIASVAVGAAAFATNGEIFSPGQLNDQSSGMVIGGVRTHAELECSACHTPFWASEHMGDRCLDCHESIQRELSVPETLHGELADAANCRTCHTEHKGAQSRLTDYNPDLYPHAEFGFYLITHRTHQNDQAFECSDCHVESLQKFGVGICGMCHLELDREFFTAHLLDFDTGCLNCHDGIDRFGADFDHGATAFPLNGTHASLECRSCHAGAVSAADLQTADPECVSCHLADDVHTGELGSDCQACHSTSDWRVADFDHNLTGFPLVEKHEELLCADCHSGSLTEPVDETCISCHAKDDVHEGQLGTDCVACHNAAGWDQVLREDFDHALTNYPLTGKHATLATCESCHLGGQLKGTPTQCAACHRKDDAHDGQFGLQCSSCHNTSTWSDATFDHNMTRFRLTGAHANTTCESCHENGKTKGTPTDCIACHRGDDAHNGDFGTKCASCHNTSTWRNADFDHSQTGFPLTGRHGNIACETCHTNGTFAGTPKNCVSCHRQDDTHSGAFGGDCSACHSTSGWGGASFDHSETSFPLSGQHRNVLCESCHTNGTFSGTPQDCVSCHRQDDAHNGSFGTNCAACHSPSGWGGASFDHNQTGFPLSGRHSNVLCESCHTNGVYAGTPQDCVSCHTQDDVHDGAFGTNCAACHSTSGWGGASFDHNQTGFPLSGGHQNVSCSSCHGSGQYAGTPTNCSACHAEPAYHAGLFGTQCQSCHSTSAWKPASYDRSHSFPMRHGDAGGNCSACHTDPLPGFRCTKCHNHDPDRMIEKHKEEPDFDLNNCLQCHPGGRKD